MSQNPRDKKWIIDEHRRRNATTRQATEQFADHRVEVTQRIVQLSRNPADRLCLLGAGNCNDVDLAALLKHFHEITLVDLDTDAVWAGVERQLHSSDLRSRIRVAESMDISGMLEEFDSISGDPRQPIAVRLQYTLQNRSRLSLSGSPFDCVVSCCLLSQLIDSLVFGLGESHPDFTATALLLRKQHVLLVADSLAPGGRGLLVFDFVSSQTLPQLMNVQSTLLTELLFAAVQSRNFFTGLNPFAVQSELKTSPVFVGMLKEVMLWRPWRWSFGSKSFGVAAISFERR
jgi:hypothetical protein